MAIVKMKHLQLIAMGSDREELMALFQRLGCLEIDQVSTQPGDAQGGDQGTGEREALLRQLEEEHLISRPDDQALDQAREDRDLAERALEVLKRFAPEKTPFLSPRPGLTEGELFREEVAQRAKEAAREINDMDRRLAAIQSELLKVEAQRASLIPWKRLDLPLDTPSTEQLIVQLGALPVAVPAEGVQLGDLAQLTPVSADREQQYCLLACHTSCGEDVLDKLKDLGWSRVNLRDWTGTAEENLTRLAQKEAELHKETQEISQVLATKGDLWPDLKRLADRATAQMSRAESKGRTLDTSSTFYLEGWVPAERWPQLEEALRPYPHACTVSDPTPEDYPKVPVLLKNNWFTKPLNMVTEMYSLPAYGSVDPNPLMAPFFIFFYGFMMADMGYGLVMMLASWIVMKKAKPDGPTMRHMMPLLGLCGVSTFIMGMLTGGFFGDLLPQLAMLIDPDTSFTALPALFSPLDDALAVLIGSLAIGLAQILTGMAVSMYRQIKRGEVMAALCNEGAWYLVFILAAVGFLLNQVKPALIAIVVLLVLTQGYGKKGVVGKLMGIGGSLYNNITGYFSDILSYSRLMALMLAGAVIAQVFNTLGALTGNVILFFIISMVGNALNFALNLLGCYVHDMRLQCLEYFGRFYEDGGIPFRPLVLDTKYHKVTK